MGAIQEPSIHFSDWQPWGMRERVAHTIEVPKHFGVLGIHLLAVQKDPPKGGSGVSEHRHLDQKVIYIGMSRHVTQRLERHHSVVGRYRSESHDPSAKHLSFANWQSPWSSYSPADPAMQVPLAYVRYVERKLLWEFVKCFSRLPTFNRA